MRDYTLQTPTRPEIATTEPSGDPPATAAPVTTWVTSGFMAGIWVEMRSSDPADFFRQAAFMESLPKHCGICNCSRLMPRHRRVREFEFFEIGCSHCKAVFSLGRRRDDGTLYPNWKKGWQPGWAPAPPQNPPAN